MITCQPRNRQRHLSFKGSKTVPAGRRFVNVYNNVVFYEKIEPMGFKLFRWRDDKKAIFILITFYIIFGAIISIFQERIIYRPNEQDFIGCSAYESAEKIEINGTRMYFKNSGPKLAVLYHGNAGSACDRSFLTDIFTNSGYSFLAVEYTGYSNDTRKPSHNLVKNDVKNTVQFVSSGRFEEVVVIGESIGSGAATYHSFLQQPDKLLLISPFSSLADLAQSKFWFYPTFLIVDNAFDNLKNLKNYNQQIVIIHGKNDEVIPYKLGQKLFLKISAESKVFIDVAGAGHNDLFINPEVYSAVYNFLKQSNRHIY